MDNKQPIYPRMVLGFDLEWEAQNWYNTFAKESVYGLNSGKTKFNPGGIPADVADIISNTESEQKSKDLIRQKVKDFYGNPEMKSLAGHRIKEAAKRWNNITVQYFTALSKMMDIPIADMEKEYFGFFTFGVRCPFHNNGFMFNQYGGFEDIAMHEIMHIEFLKKYRQHCLDKGLDETKIQHLKEILTILLNQDMRELLSKPDSGYTKHLEIRSKVLEIYKQNRDKNGDFTIFLNEVIELVKNIDFS